jgi:hypothetical protein
MMSSGFERAVEGSTCCKMPMSREGNYPRLSEEDYLLEQKPLQVDVMALPTHQAHDSTLRPSTRHEPGHVTAVSKI